MQERCSENSISVKPPDLFDSQLLWGPKTPKNRGNFSVSFINP